MAEVTYRRCDTCDSGFGLGKPYESMDHGTVDICDKCAAKIFRVLAHTMTDIQKCAVEGFIAEAMDDARKRRESYAKVKDMFGPSKP